MAATSYTALPSSSYVGLSSDGDPYQNANFGSYGTGIGSLTSHPYQYQTRLFASDLTDNYQPTSYSEEFLRSQHAHTDPSTEQVDYYSNNQYAQPPTLNQESSHHDDNYGTQTGHRTTTDYQPHHASHSDTNQNHHQQPHTNPAGHHSNHPTSPKSQRQQHPGMHAAPHSSGHQASPKSQHHPPHANQTGHHPSEHPTPPKSHHQSHANHAGPHPADHHTSPKSQHPQSHANHAGPHPSERPTPPKSQQHQNHAGPHPADHPTPPKSQHQPSNRQNNRSEVNSRDHPTPPKPTQQQQQQQQRNQSQPNQARSDRQQPKKPPPNRRRSPSQSGNELPSTATGKTKNPPPETRPTKSMQMRAAAIKQKEELQEQKRKDGNFPGLKKKSTPPKSKPSNSPSDDEHEEHAKSKRTKKSTHSKPHKSRHDDHHHRPHTDDNNSSGDDNNQTRSPRGKSKKRTAHSDSRHERHPTLPPVRRGQGPPYYDPIYDYPYPYRGRHSYYDDYAPYPYYGGYDRRYRHLYDDPYDLPPYPPPRRDHYDGLFDYEKHKEKSRKKKHSGKKEATTDHEDHDAVTGNETERDDDTKSAHSKKGKTPKKSSKEDDEYEAEESARRRWARHYYGTPHYDDREALELWRQERNDYLKKSYKPTVHDVLYAQQFIKSDSYLENQRRRAVRDAQGYYFPYKKYTLKDYKDLQKQEAHHNPYASVVEPTLDRKERAKKRQEYASHIERQIVDTTGGVHHHTPREIPPRKAWHLNSGEPNDSDKLSKRERALEYAKEQVVKHRPQRAPKNRSHQADPTEEYVNNLFPEENADDDNAYERDNQTNDDDEE